MGYPKWSPRGRPGMNPETRFLLWEWFALTSLISIVQKKSASIDEVLADFFKVFVKFL